MLQDRHADDAFCLRFVANLGEGLWAVQPDDPGPPVDVLQHASAAFLCRRTSVAVKWMTRISSNIKRYLLVERVPLPLPRQACTSPTNCWLD